MATPPPKRVPENAPGDFYVGAGACTQCCLPHAEAPELLNDPDTPFRECYYRRQPQNQAEVEHALRAVAVCCVDAHRYGGSDLSILARLEQLTGPNARADWGGSQPDAQRRTWWQRLFGGA